MALIIGWSRVLLVATLAAPMNTHILITTNTL